jgi:hypothetical protein
MICTYIYLTHKNMQASRGGVCEREKICTHTYSCNKGGDSCNSSTTVLLSCSVFYYDLDSV